MDEFCFRRKRSSLALPRPQRRPSQCKDNGDEVFFSSAKIVTAYTLDKDKDKDRGEEINLKIIVMNSDQVFFSFEIIITVDTPC